MPAIKNQSYESCFVVLKIFKPLVQSLSYVVQLDDQ